MALQLVIIGLPQSGKTTVFNALTRSEAPTGVFSTGEEEPNLATVKVPDERLDVLTRMFNPRRTVPADVQYYDIAGLAKGIHEQGMSGRLLGYLSQGAALVHVVRAFEDPSVPHPESSVDPLRDIETLNLELSFSDLALIEKRLGRIESTIPKLRGAEREANEREAEVLRRLKAALEEGTPIREVELQPEEERLLRGFGFLTAKPLLILLNVGEEQLGAPAQALVEEARARFGRPGVEVDALAGKIEAEIAVLDEEDAALFMADLGITESSRDRVIRLSYALLGLISFFTVGPDEVRAWTIRRGTPAVEAAGEIHTDIQRGFIRAEVVSYDDLIAAGGLPEARKAGKLRLEGKQYIVQDGDIVHFLFNV
ncbi:redox-regulated ATPase YchF [Sphaerobacter sp.]|uniref:redox-regulated ATPase YchF n=1 Tax=Sphaerobacter sp. TaxID=2099654 RepID=UPI001E0627FD|nr:redox-regulated ATPase YchF [Sphaerobacter sp.]MBX5444157.1 redox-regulated ATPase YchF [Sphaerobacter sp.]